MQKQMPTGRKPFINKTITKTKTMSLKLKPIAIWLLRILAALILLQTLYFKFTGHPQSVELFTKIGMEPWGRIGTGIFELIASILMLYPRTTGIGAVLGVGLMAGAIFFHLTKLGLDFGGDYVLLIYAVITFICCTILAFIYRGQVFKLAGIKLKS